jgi:hypothetical protein
MIIWFSSFLMTTPLATKKSVFTRQLARASRSALWTGVSSIQKESGKYHNSGGFQHHAEGKSPAQASGSCTPQGKKIILTVKAREVYPSNKALLLICLQLIL